MTGIWKFPSKNGRERGLMALYILHSLAQSPKSGYDLLKEIEEKTEGTWVPSKGTLYPLLKQLEEEALIRLFETGKRSKQVYELTETGEETLRAHRQHRRESREKMLQMKNLLVEIFGDEKRELNALFVEIRSLIDALPSEKDEEAGKILGQCLEDLRRIK
ncbi:PadR family transcriptional regulator [Methanofollis aquaemaris]|uniref:PadR family transcriptional regulator n=1 Tax=Methanofollis aquaemaris TaxID=126734 RepID=A0A8A3S2B9_9EURY|nr:PadR family transcriptional regulator [Methanofollis aquaemaris]QSZ66368.1 PadR family transcriptional regulator [Methanofollis aquaemaris]